MYIYIKKIREQNKRKTV